MNLKEFIIESLLYEKIRSKRFKMSEFRSLKTHEEILKYAYRNLKEIGQGSSRAVFALSSRFVLKVAMNKRGIAQNEAELDIYTDPATKSITSKIIEYDNQYNWLISELVRPIINRFEFHDLTGIRWFSFTEGIEEAVYEGIEEAINFIRSEHITLDQKSIEFITAVFTMARNTKILRGDLSRVDHWGKTTNGQVVVLDYGFTENVREKYYSN